MNYAETLLQVTSGELDASDPAVTEAEAAQLATAVQVPPYMPEGGKPRLAFIGETVGADEMKAGRPFAGRAGEELRRWCTEAGIDFDSAYMDNAFPVRGAESLSEEMKDKYRGDCIIRTEACWDTNDLEVIVLLGNEALKIFLSQEGITKKRGNAYPAGKVVYVPMLNPAAVLRDTSLRRRCIFDMQRVKRILDEGYTEPAPLQHDLIWCDGKWLESNAAELVAEVEYFLHDPDKKLVIDIETAALDDRITCVGFSIGFRRSLTFQWPTKDDDSFTADMIRRTVSRFCASPCTKVLHNGLYDAWWLKHYEGIDLVNWTEDTMGMAQVWCATDSLSLEYLTSILTDIPYYKDEGKDHFKHAPKTREGWEQLMTYCGLDAIATWLGHVALDVRLRLQDRRRFYDDNYVPKLQPMLETMLRGTRVDHEKRKAVMGAFLGLARVSRDALADYNGGEPMFTLTTQRDQRIWEALQNQTSDLTKIPKTKHTFYSIPEVGKSIAAIDAKTMSSAKLKELLYGKLGLPVQYERRANGEETPTAGNLTLRKLLLEYPDRQDVQDVIALAIDHNRNHKLAEFCYDNMEDADGRFRFSLKFTPETGRFASSKAPNGCGKNSQNLPHIDEIRRLILPEEGHVLLKVDMSQVEARFCFMYTRDPELVQLANLRPAEYDQHSENAVILRLVDTPVGVPRPLRQLAKKVVHGAQRNMQAPTLQDSLLKDADLGGDIDIPPLEECERMLEAYHTRYPAIRSVFFEETRRKMQTDRYLVNSWGRVWGLPYHDLDEEAMRRAFSFLLQSEAADLINRCGFVPMINWLRDSDMESRLMLHAHDELVFSCAPAGVYTVALMLSERLEVTREVCGNLIRIPLEFGLGRSWAVEHEWKSMPSLDELAGAVVALLR